MLRPSVCICSYSCFHIVYSLHIYFYSISLLDLYATFHIILYTFLSSIRVPVIMSCWTAFHCIIPLCSTYAYVIFFLLIINKLAVLHDIVSCTVILMLWYHILHWCSLCCCGVWIVSIICGSPVMSFTILMHHHYCLSCHPWWDGLISTASCDGCHLDMSAASGDYLSCLCHPDLVWSAIVVSVHMSMILSWVCSPPSSHWTALEDPLGNIKSHSIIVLASFIWCFF